MGRNGRRAAKRFLGLVLVLASGGLAGCGDLASLGFAIRLLGVSLSGGARLGVAGGGSSSSAPTPFETVTPTRWTPGPVIGWTPTPQGWMPVYGVGNADSKSSIGPVEEIPNEGLDKTKDQSEVASTKESVSTEGKGDAASDPIDSTLVCPEPVTLTDSSTPLMTMARSGLVGAGSGLLGQE